MRGLGVYFPLGYSKTRPASQSSWFNQWSRPISELVGEGMHSESTWKRMEYLVRTIANFKNSSILGMLVSWLRSSRGGAAGCPLRSVATKVSGWVARSKGNAMIVGD